MKTLISSLFFVMLYSISYGQCSSIDCTPTASGFDLLTCDNNITSGAITSFNPGEVYCITGTGVSIETSVPAGVVIYVSPTGSITSSTNVNQFDGTLIIEDGATVSLNEFGGSGTNPSAIHNYGTLNFNTIFNMDFNDTLVNYSNGVVSYLSTATLSADGDATGGAVIVNCGQFNGQDMQLNQNTCVVNYFEFLMDGTVTLSGATVDNFGVISAEEDVVINTQTVPTSLNNQCIVYAADDFAVNSELTNDGYFIAAGEGIDNAEITINGSATFTNNGSVYTEAFRNDGVVTGSGGMFHIDLADNNNTSNNGSFTGDAVNNLHFYDVQVNPANTNGDVFDNGNTPTNTINTPFNRLTLDFQDFSTCAILLPVELLGFDVELQEAGAYFSWATALEIENKGFELQQFVGNSFEKIAFIEGLGNSELGAVYNFLLEDVPTGTSTYRLVQEDFDGTKTYSDLVVVNHLKDVQVLPTIVTRGEEVIIKSESIQSVYVVDVAGKLVHSAQYYNVEEVEVLTNDFAKGVYFINVDGIVQKIVVQ